jgi:hypothetical protein
MTGGDSNFDLLCRSARSQSLYRLSYPTEPIAALLFANSFARQTEGTEIGSTGRRVTAGAEELQLEILNY